MLMLTASKFTPLAVVVGRDIVGPAGEPVTESEGGEVEPEPELVVGDDTVPVEKVVAGAVGPELELAAGTLEPPPPPLLPALGIVSTS